MELVIDDKNFDKYFRDVRRNRPERDEVIARYSAVAYLGDGQLKRDLIYLLQNKDKAIAASQVMRKLGCATEKDSLAVCRQICQDLASGMTEDEVAWKEYRYIFESFYYTKKEYIPLDDPHWSSISIANLDDFLDAGNQRVTMKARIVDGETHDCEVR